jgi:serine/threonine-protein kinase RsbW
MDDTRGAVTIEVPAQAEYVAVLRAAAGVIASRLDFTLDDIDDLRILIDEAASVLLTSGAEGTLHCQIDAAEETIRFRLRAAAAGEEVMVEGGFAWSILQALAHEVTSETRDGWQIITVTRSRGPVLDTAF